MQSKGVKIGFIVLVILVFGGAIFFMYGPNSENAKQLGRNKKEYSKYIKAQARIVTWEGNGRIGKGADVVYTLQFKEEKTESLKTATVTGQEMGWDLKGKEKGAQLTLYYNPENPNIVISEERYKDALN